MAAGRLWLLPLTALLSCSQQKEQDSPPPPPKPAEARIAAPSPSTVPAPGRAALNGAGDAAAVVRNYYDLIAARAYERAFALRWPTPNGDASAFAREMGRYREYRATVGTPSRPAEAGNSVYVEVPVHLYGTTSDGKPFSSAGTVTLRREAGGGGPWRIYPH